jgi:hypothetical protein
MAGLECSISFGRTRLMGVAIKRFLKQVNRSDPNDDEARAQSLRQRYVPGVSPLFTDVAKDTDSRRLLRQQVAEAMHSLITYWADYPKHSGKDTDKNLVRIFYEQCDVQEEKVAVKAKTGGNVMQNPSEPDATYDGHKGPGYPVQLSETCHPENQVPLITCAIPQTAAGEYRGVPATLQNSWRHRGHPQRPEAKDRLGTGAGSRPPGGVPCDFTESGGLEYAAGDGLRKNATNCP